MENPETNFGWLLLSESEATQDTIRRFIGKLGTDNRPTLGLDYTSAPTVQPLLITNVMLTGNQFRFSFEAESNRTYAVDYRDGLGTNLWTTLTNLPAQPMSATFHFTDILSSAQRVFRVRSP